ncbi:MAG TPA: hypothetical protein VFH43_06575 [Candidatus Kapabacteria bacterium]|nr:hypothetical protein [Candidatus Kapabacteria bacterium]
MDTERKEPAKTASAGSRTGVRADQNVPTTLAFREGQPLYRGKRDISGIDAWGVDLEHSRRPAYPKERIPPRLEVPWDEPEPQKQNVEVLVSVEHVKRPPVFGSVQPPSGLSGVLRRAAFGWAEADIRHWLILIMADRINVVEGVIDDLAHGHVPNVFAEMGWKAKYKYNKRGFITKVGVMALIAGAGIFFLAQRGREDRDRD